MDRSAYVMSVNTQSFIIIALNCVRAAYLASGRLHIIHTHLRCTHENGKNILDMCTSIEFQLDPTHRIDRLLLAMWREQSIRSHAFGQFVWILLLNNGKRKFPTDLPYTLCWYFTVMMLMLAPWPPCIRVIFYCYCKNARRNV